MKRVRGRLNSDGFVDDDVAFLGLAARAEGHDGGGGEQSVT